MTLRICGNSHTAALYEGAQLIGDAVAGDIYSFGGTRWERVDFSAVAEDHVFFVEKALAANRKRKTDDYRFDKDCLWGLVTGTHTSRLYSDRYWLGAAPGEIAGNDRQPISSGLVDRLIEADQANVRLFLKRMHATRTPCFVISCPPPRRDHPNLHKDGQKDMALHFDARARRMFRDFIAGLDIDFVEAPPESYDADGFLKPEYELHMVNGGLRDHLHANADYGALMMPRIHAYVDQRSAV